ncbi:ArsR/SmtB family transcription factor [Melioribacter sp. OK-6-Me]|uniref:ArsR/SmtB family transcription factor n=1 Tax=unclassified Melioribacter TaxID=2627329 RepID=UPI003ED903D0
MKSSPNLFKVLSDNNRLRIIKMLQIRPLCGCEIMSILNLAASTVSQHLSLLKKTGFIIEKKEGRWTKYYINSSASDERILAILTTFDFWIGDLKSVEKDRVKVRSINKYALSCKK